MKEKLKDGVTLKIEKILTVVSFRVSVSLVERLRNAAYWRRESINSIGYNAIESEVNRLEQENGGKRYAARPKK